MNAPVSGSGFSPATAENTVPHPGDSVKQENQRSLREDTSEAIDIAAEMQTADGQKMFSLRSFSEDYYVYRDMLLKHGTAPEEVDALFYVIDEVMKDIGANREILDFGWNVGREDRSFSPIKPNSDPLYKVSMDFSTLCGSVFSSRRYRSALNPCTIPSLQRRNVSPSAMN